MTAAPTKPIHAVLTDWQASAVWTCYVRQAVSPPFSEQIIIEPISPTHYLVTQGGVMQHAQ